MRRIGFVLRMAWRETRASRRRLFLFASAISIGVGALVAIGSLDANLEEAVRRQARELLGADLELSSNRRFTAPVEAALDSIARQGVRVARRNTFNSMAYLRHTEGIRLVDVRAVGGGFPFYGDIVTSPAGRWRALDTGRVAIVDTSLLVSLGARVGDTLELGQGRFAIAAAVSEVPGHVAGGFNAFGSQVYIPVREMAGTGLVVFGSRVRYSALLKFDDARQVRRFVRTHRGLFEKERVRDRSAEQSESQLNEVLNRLASFLQFVGLVALLLGGIGVASGVGAFVAGKLDTVAVMRCLGASRPLVFAIYLTQAVALGLIAAAVGALGGVGAQFMLPRLLKSLLPVDIAIRIEPGVVLGGVAIGAAVAVLFALRPLLEVRMVSPLQAIRRAFEGDPTGTPRDPLRLLAQGALAVGVLLLCLWRNEDQKVGVWSAVAITLMVGTLALAARLAVWGARRVTQNPRFRARWPYVLRQGLANLHRPRNQTRSVVIALGFGVGLLAALYLIQANLLRQVVRTTLAAQGQPNIVFIDIQSDQISGVEQLVRGSGHSIIQSVPIVPMRIAAINGRKVGDVQRDTGRTRPAQWTLRREYRSTYRDTGVTSEKVVSGRWWRGSGEAGPGGPFPVSLSTDLSRDLRVHLGDRITWNVQGLMVETRVMVLREVEWARFEPNFFAVFSTAALERAPHTVVLASRVDDAAQRARLQRSIAERYPNVTSYDVALIQRTVERVFSKVALAIRFMAAFSLATGALVLLGAVAAGRLERIREGALLKALGATRRQLGRIFLAEYVALGVLSAVVGIGLATLAAWAFTHWVFDLEFVVPVAPLSVVLALTALLVTIVGMTASREVFARTAMEVLRDV